MVVKGAIYVAFLLVPVLSFLTFSFFYSSKQITYLETPFGSVNITYDDYSIPCIFASSKLSAYFTLGYLHATNRLFSLHYNRASAYGILSEVIFNLILDIR